MKTQSEVLENFVKHIENKGVPTISSECLRSYLTGQIEQCVYWFQEDYYLLQEAYQTILRRTENIVAVIMAISPNIKNKIDKYANVVDEFYDDIWTQLEDNWDYDNGFNEDAVDFANDVVDKFYQNLAKIGRET